VDTPAWPHDHAGACVVSVDVDGEVPLLWRSRNGAPGLAELEQRRFGPRVGLRRLLDVFAERGVTASFYVPGQYAETHPELIVAVAEAGHEVGLHGYLHEPPTALSKDEFAQALARSTQSLHNAAGVRPTGFRSPSWDMTQDAFDVLGQAGLRYDSSMMGSDRPYWVNDLVEVPVQWTLDDAPFYRYVGGTEPGHPPSRPCDLAGRWVEELEAAQRFGTLAVLTVHDWLSGRAAAAAALDELLRRLETLDLWRATADEVARWHIESEGRPPADGPSNGDGGE
jgi:peptidoglycan/xylan/chitin deacetylase (PgdA/CDA1 family)